MLSICSIQSCSSGGRQKMLSFCTMQSCSSEEVKICCLFALWGVVVPEEVKRYCLFALWRDVVPEEVKRCCLFALCRGVVPEKGKRCCLQLLFRRKAKDVVFRVVVTEEGKICLFWLTTFIHAKTETLTGSAHLPWMRIIFCQTFPFSIDQASKSGLQSCSEHQGRGTLSIKG